MTREEFYQYAHKNGLLVWPRGLSERAIEALEREQQQTGRWIFKGGQQYTYGIDGTNHVYTTRIKMMCSECGFIKTVVVRHDTGLYQYCPGCGAKMEGWTDMANKTQAASVDALKEKIEDVKDRICEEYCKYPRRGCQDGEDIGWPWEEEGSPCLSCPLNEL